MLCNYKVIDYIGKSTIENWLYCYSQGFKDKINSMYNEEQKHHNRSKTVLEDKFALEQYIIRSFNKDSNQQYRLAMENIVDSVLDRFLSGDYSVLNSYFLKEKNLAYFYTDEQIKAFKEAYRKYSEKANHIYDTFEKRGFLTSSDKEILMRYFIYNISAEEDSACYQKQLNYINYLFETYNRNFTNLFEMEFVCQFVLNYFKNNVCDNIYFSDYEIIVADLKNTTCGLHCPSCKTVYISSNRNLFKNKIAFVNVIFHELQHSRQKYDSHIKCNRIAYIAAKDDVLDGYLSSDWFSKYDSNYCFEDIEVDADTNGYHMMRSFMSKIIKNRNLLGPISNTSVTLYKNRRDYHSSPFSLFIDDYDVFHIKENFDYENLCRIIGDNTYLLNIYPVFNLLFNSDGIVKTFEELLIEKSSIEHDIGVFSDFLKVGIKKNELSNIDINDYSDKDKIEIFKKIIYVLKEEISNLTEGLRIYKKHKKFFSKIYYFNTMYNHINISNKCLTFINDNIDILFDLKAKYPNNSFLQGSLMGINSSIRAYKRSISYYGRMNVVDKDLNDLENVMDIDEIIDSDYVTCNR